MENLLKHAYVYFCATACQEEMLIFCTMIHLSMSSSQIILTQKEKMCD